MHRSLLISSTSEGSQDDSGSFITSFDVLTSKHIDALVGLKLLKFRGIGSNVVEDGQDGSDWVFLDFFPDWGEDLPVVFEGWDTVLEDFHHVIRAALGDKDLLHNSLSASEVLEEASDGRCSLFNTVVALEVSISSFWFGAELGVVSLSELGNVLLGIEWDVLGEVEDRFLDSGRLDKAEEDLDDIGLSGSSLVGVLSDEGVEIGSKLLDELSSEELGVLFDDFLDFFNITDIADFASLSDENDQVEKVLLTVSLELAIDDGNQIDSGHDGRLWGISEVFDETDEFSDGGVERLEALKASGDF